MKTTKSILAAVAIAAAMFSACTQNTPEPEQPQSYRSVTLNFSTRVMSEVTTRALADEDKIVRIALFGIDAKGGVTQTFDIIENPSAAGNVVSLKPEVASLRIIANPKGEHTLSYNDVSQFEDIRVNLADAPRSPFAMSGSVGVPSTIGGPINVELTRTVAKLVVKGDKGFTVTSVGVSRTPSYGFLFPREDLPAFELQDYTGYSEVAGNEVYVGENGTQNPTKLSVRGVYKGREITYNVTLQKDKAPVAVARNTCYSVTVAPIDETEANVDVVVVDWSNIVLDNGAFNPRGNYYSVDFHNHTGFTDGSNPILFVLNQGKKYGLDIIVNSEHGGADPHNASDGEGEDDPMPTWTSLNITPAGTPNNGQMWRWESIMKYSWKKVQEFNRKNSTTIIAVQGLEWNPPGHEHCSAGVITGQFDGNDNANAMAQFEYMFDDRDKDTEGGAQYGWVKSTKSGHEKSLEGAAWMQKNHPHTSWLVAAHPERQNKWLIEHYRDLNNIAPDVFVGFESIPGHQASSQRGGYGNTASYDKTYTFGGVGVQSAKIGGLWDAMISEGRRFWLVANSDYHRNATKGGGDFYPGEYQKTYISMSDRTPQSFVDGLRAGNIYNVHGDLIDKLQFSIGSATMGQTLVTTAGQITVSIVVRDPDAVNYNKWSALTNPTLDHIDLIAGKMRPRVAPGSAEYSVAEYNDVAVVARFDATGGVMDTNNLVSTRWEDMGDGFRKMTYVFNLDGDTYFRLRGTNHGLNVADETDGAGNPLVDAPSANVQEGAARAFNDLWFYSNPIFVKQVK